MSDEHEKFHGLLRRLMNVPKKELVEKEQQYKKQRKKIRKQKRARR